MFIDYHGIEMDCKPAAVEVEACKIKKIVAQGDAKLERCIEILKFRVLYPVRPVTHVYRSQYSQPASVALPCCACSSCVKLLLEVSVALCGVYEII